MRADVPSWNKFALLENTQFTQPAFVDDAESVEFQQRIHSIPLVSRAHFFDLLTLNKHLGRSMFESIEVAEIHRRIAYWGLDINQSTTQLINSGLVEWVSDPLKILLTKTREQIITFLDLNHVAHKKSWAKEQLALVAVERLPRQTILDSDKFLFVDIPSRYHAPCKNSLEYLDKVSLIYRIWLGFGLPISQN
jgi:hypothetical protein